MAGSSEGGVEQHEKTSGRNRNGRSYPDWQYG